MSGGRGQGRFRARVAADLSKVTTAGLPAHNFALSPASRLTVGELAFDVPVVTPDTPIRDVDRLFRRDRHLRAVIVAAGPGAALLSREQLEFELSGPFGYGRSLHSRSRARDLTPQHDVALPARATLTEAAELILSREPEHRYRDILIEADGGYTVAGVSAVFEELSAVFRHVAFHDPLTGLPNRRLLDQHGHTLTRKAMPAARTAILYIDLDGFKLVNDSYGHRAGDEVLIAFGERLRSCVRPTDVIARLGGDEFAALLTDISEVHALAIADRIVLTASAPFVYEDQPLHVSASVGFAMADDVSGEVELSPLDVLLRHADEAMLQAKRSGKQRVTRLAGDAPATGVARTNLIRRRLGTALAGGDGFELHYQTRRNLGTDDDSCVEALLRWTDPELGAVSPAEFIPIAEETDHIHRLSDWVLNQACAQARRWLDAGTPRSISVNLSPTQFARDTVVDSVLSAVNAHGLSANSLRVEITEGTPLTDLPRAVKQLSILRTAGISVELDDFGTGNSSLSRLKDLPLDTIKIDKSFIDDIDLRPASAALVRGVIDIAHAFGLTVTAEGVERPTQLAILKQLLCDDVQGFLIHRPAEAADLEAHEPAGTVPKTMFPA
jgi:diguanylate cyclase (GGDEF)-like protein